MKWGNLAEEEMFRVFNLGIGMILIMPSTTKAAVLELLPEARLLGQLEKRPDEQAAVHLAH